MFPNVRLLIGALVASVVALSCGFGVFAAFRVNHDPLGRLPADAAALQLVTSEAAGPHPAWDAPFGSGFSASQSVSEARIGVTDAPAPMPIRRDTIELSNTAIVGSVQPEAATPTVSSASPAAASAQQASVANTPSTQPAAAVKPDASGKTGEPAIASDRAVAAIGAPPAATPAVITATAPEAAPPATKSPPKLIGDAPRKTPRKAIRKPIERRRVAARRPIIRKTPPRAVARYGDQDFRDPVFQSGPGAFQRQPATSPQSDRRTSEHAPGNNAAGNSYGWLTPQ